MADTIALQPFLNGPRQSGFRELGTSSRVSLWHGYWSSAVSRVIQRKQLPVGNEECNTFVTRWLCLVYTARRWDATTTVLGDTTSPRNILLVYDLFTLFLLSVVVPNFKTLLVLCIRQSSLIWLLKILGRRWTYGWIVFIMDLLLCFVGLSIAFHQFLQFVLKIFSKLPFDPVVINI